MSPFDLRDKLLAGACLALLVVSVGLGVYAGKQVLKVQALRVDLANLKTDRANDAAQAASDRAALQETYRLKERALQASFNQSMETRDAEIRSAAITADELRRRLRASGVAAGANQAGGAGADPAVQPYPTGSVGALISGQAQFLVDESQRAETIRAGLKQCYRDLDAARAALKGGR